MTTHSVAIITCSYGPDFARCKRLCKTVDQFVASDVEHLLIVPQRDLTKFFTLVSPRRRILTVEEVVPGWFKQLPGTDRWWLSAFGIPVRGWIMQQITKLSANFATPAEHLLFADSDIQFIRAFDTTALFRGDRLRLHRLPDEQQAGRHLQWHNRAAKLLGIPGGYQGADYVGQLITWKRSNLGLLQNHIEHITGRPWYQAVGSSLHFSEYILYGVFVDKILGLRTAGQFSSQEVICHCCWFLEEAQALGQGRATISTKAVALLMQSNLKLSIEEEHGLIAGASPLNPALNGATA